MPVKWEKLARFFDKLEVTVLLKPIFTGGIFLNEYLFARKCLKQFLNHSAIKLFTLVLVFLGWMDCRSFCVFHRPRRGCILRFDILLGLGF